MRGAHVLIDLGPETRQQGRTFWADALGWRVGDPFPDHPEFRSLEPPGGEPGWVHLQDVDAGVRVHLDLSVDDLPATRDRLLRLGAGVLRDVVDCVTLRSPGGMVFCLVTDGAPLPGSRPVVTTWPDRHRSRLVQVCLDSPSERHDGEVAFWRQATGWRWEPSGYAEFAGTLYPDPSSPVQLLLQRLGADDPGTDTRAHLDLGTDDVAAEVARLESVGARHLRSGDGFVALTDPTGMAFCVTGRPPEGGGRS